MARGRRHTDGRPRRHARHSPHPGAGRATTTRARLPARRRRRRAATIVPPTRGRGPIPAVRTARARGGGRCRRSRSATPRRAPRRGRGPGGHRPLLHLDRAVADVDRGGHRGRVSRGQPSTPPSRASRRERPSRLIQEHVTSEDAVMQRLVPMAALVAVLVLVGAAPGAAAPRPLTPRPRCRGLVADLAVDPSVPGEALAVRAPGPPAALAAGVADTSARTPLAADTPFRVASMTKTFVAAAVLRLVEEGKVKLDAPITKYLSPESLDVLLPTATSSTTSPCGSCSSTPRASTTTRPTTRTTTRTSPTRAPLDTSSSSGSRSTTATRSQRRASATLRRHELHPARRDPRARHGGVAARRGAHAPPSRPTRARPHVLGDPRAHPARHAAGPPVLRDAYDNIVLDASHDLYGGGGLVSTVDDLARFYRGSSTARSSTSPRRCAR